MNNFQKIKAMDINEMAKHHALFARAVINGAFAALKLAPIDYPPMEVSIANQKQWLEQESEEFDEE